MTISLITVCFNSVRTLGTALSSVRRQRGVEIEYIVVDGGSRDGTVDLLSSFAKEIEKNPCAIKTFKYVSERDDGMYDAINKGIAMASGEIVGILNADDVFENDDSLATIARAFDENIDAVYGDIRFVEMRSKMVEGSADEKLDELRACATRRLYSARMWRPWMLQWGFMPPHPTVYIRRELFAKLGGYKLGYQIAADYELLVRYLRRAAIRTRYIRAVIVAMRPGGKSTNNWKSNIILNKENVRANRENGYICFFVMMLPKYFFKIWEFIIPKIKRFF